MPFTNVNETDLYYEEKGQGHPLLFIHGMCGDASVWDDQMSRLSNMYRCISYDRRGHSRSPLGNIKERTVEMHADDAASLILKLDIWPCTLVASSGGARVALDVVRRYSRLLKGAVLSEPPLLALDPEGAKAFMAQVKLAVETAMAEGGPRQAVDAFFGIACPGLWSKLPDSSRDKYRNNHAELFGDLQMRPYQVSKDDLTKISLPCLVIRGTDSLPVFRSIASVLAESIPGAKLLDLAESGHVTYFERPRKFAAAVTGFVSGM